MTTQDLFYFIASIGVIVITTFVSVVAYRAIKTLDNLDFVLSELKGVANNIISIKSGVKLGVFSLITAIANRLRHKKA